MWHGFKWLFFLFPASTWAPRVRHGSAYEGRVIMKIFTRDGMAVF